MKNLLATLLLLLASPAYAQTGVLILSTGGSLDSQYTFGAGYFSRSQRVLEDVAGHRQLLGLGPAETQIVSDGTCVAMSMAGSPNVTFADVGVAGDTITRSAGSFVTDGFVAGQEVFVYGSASNNISCGLITNVAERVLTLGSRELVNEGPVGSVSIVGVKSFVTVEDYGTGAKGDGRFALVSGVAVDCNQTSNTGQGSLTTVQAVCNAIGLSGGWQRIEGCIIRNFKGAGITTDVRCHVNNCHIYRGFIGVVASSDSQISNCYSAGFRDAGIWVPSPNGAVQSVRNHWFGVNNGDGAGGAGTAGAAGLFEGRFCTSTNDNYADSFYGIKSHGQNNSFTNCFIQKNSYRDVSLGQSNQLIGCTIKAMPDTTVYDKTAAVEFLADRCDMIGGVIELYINDTALTASGTGYPAIYVGSTSHSCSVMNVRIIDYDAAAGSTAIVLAGSVLGFKANITTYGFHDTASRILDCTSGTPEGLDVTIHSMAGAYPGHDDRDFTEATVASYIDLPSGWSGSVKCFNDTTGENWELVEGDAY